MTDECKCPNCGSTKVLISNPFLYMKDELECQDCGAKWIDEYVMVETKVRVRRKSK